MALPLVLLILLITGVLGTLLAWAAVLEARAGGNAVREVQALAVAEAGAARVAAALTRPQAAALPPGSVVTASADLGSAGRYAATFRALGNGVFLVRSDGVDPAGKARRTVAFLGHLRDSTDTLARFGALAPLARRGWLHGR